MISEALRLLRVFHDMKQNDLAERLGIAKSYLSEIESGKKAPSLELVEKYSRVFGIPSSSILFFSENVSRDDRGDTDARVRTAIAGKVVQFLKFVESKSDGPEKSLRNS